MIDKKPFLVRAMHEWISANHWTPLILVQTAFPGVKLPAAQYKEESLALNISMSAAHGLVIGDEQLTCALRFSGVSHPVSVPIGAIVAIYARENGEGMMFGLSDPAVEPLRSDDPQSPVDEVDTTPPASKRPAHLRVIK